MGSDATPDEVREWLLQAHPDLLEEFRSVLLMRELRRHRNDRFQLISMYDGAMDRGCKEMNRRGYVAMDSLIKAIDSLPKCAPAESLQREQKSAAFFKLKTAMSPRWRLKIGKIRIQWWPQERWHKKLEIGWW